MKVTAATPTVQLVILLHATVDQLNMEAAGSRATCICLITPGSPPPPPYLELLVNLSVQLGLGHVSQHGNWAPVVW
jgi:hypothetical protein